MKKLIVFSILVAAVLSLALAGCDDRDSDSAYKKAAKYFAAMTVDERVDDPPTVANITDNRENGGELPGGGQAAPWTDTNIACVNAASTTDAALLCVTVPAK